MSSWVGVLSGVIPYCFPLATSSNLESISLCCLSFISMVSTLLRGRRVDGAVAGSIDEGAGEAIVSRRGLQRKRKRKLRELKGPC